MFLEDVHVVIVSIGSIRQIYASTMAALLAAWKEPGWKTRKQRCHSASINEPFFLLIVRWEAKERLQFGKSARKQKMIEWRGSWHKEGNDAKITMDGDVTDESLRIYDKGARRRARGPMRNGCGIGWEFCQHSKPFKGVGVMFLILSSLSASLEFWQMDMLFPSRSALFISERCCQKLLEKQLTSVCRPI